MKLALLPPSVARRAGALLLAASLTMSIGCAQLAGLGPDECATGEIGAAAQRPERTTLDCTDAIAGQVSAAYDAATARLSPPAPPAGFRGERDSSRIVLRWSDTSNETYYSLSAFNLRSGQSFALPAPAPRLGANSTMFVDDVLGPTQTGGAEYRLQACNAGGCSAPAKAVVR
jgi:hypothetical protein